jgi:hypothetical protein
VEQYPNEASAKRAVASLLVNINAESPRFTLEAISVQTLVEHYREKELGKDSNKDFATCQTYQGYFRKWILPRWGNYRLKDVKSVAIEEWLCSLDLFYDSKAQRKKKFLPCWRLPRSRNCFSISRADAHCRSGRCDDWARVGELLALK